MSEQTKTELAPNTFFFGGLDISYMLTIKMTDSIKLFRFIQIFYQFYGIYPLQLSQNHRSFNVKKCVFLICGVQCIVSSLLFLLFEVKSMFEYGMTFYTLLWTIFSMGLYLIPAWQMKETLEFIECCERFIEASKILFKKLI